MFNHLKILTNILHQHLQKPKIDVIFQFGSLKRTTHEVHVNNAPNKTFKNIHAYGTKKLKNKQKL